MGKHIIVWDFNRKPSATFYRILRDEFGITGGSPQYVQRSVVVVGSEGYRFQVWVKGSGAWDTWLTIRWYSDLVCTAVLGSDVIPLVGEYADWTLVSEDFVSPAGAQSCAVEFSAPPAEINIFGDSFSLRRVLTGAGV